MNPEIEAYASTLHPMMAELVRLCPNAKLPTDLDQFEEKHQAHFIVMDDDSAKAASVTMEAFGGDVTELTTMGSNLHVWFANELRAKEALSFYRQLPEKMTRFTAADAVRLLRRIRK